MLSAKLKYPIRLLISLASAHFLGSVLLKSVGLASYYFASTGMPIYVLILWRLLNYIIVGGVEFFVLYFVLKNKTVRSKMSERNTWGGAK